MGPKFIWMIIISLMTIKLGLSALPSIGKFVIIKFNDEQCLNSVKVKLNIPNSPCWSTEYNNGIKQISYNETTQMLTASFFNTNNCYSSLYETQTFPCNNTCQPVPQGYDQSDYKYFKCSYVSFPSKANFTFYSYADSECQLLNKISVLKGNSNCWPLSAMSSITPITFNSDNYKDLSLIKFSSNDCTGVYGEVQDIVCDNKCFSINNDDQNYYRCTYIAGDMIKINVVLILLFLSFLW